MITDHARAHAAPLSCHYADRLQAMLEDQLDPDVAHAVEVHVEACLLCQESLGALTAQLSDPDTDLEFFNRLKQLAVTPTPNGSIEAVVAAEGLPVIAGFRLLRVVGQGGMGTVFEAVELALGRRVALKVVALNEVGSPTAAFRFRREARLAAQLHHTNIVPVLGVGADAGYLYYSMQFIEGQSLDRLLHQCRQEAGGARCPDSRLALGANPNDIFTLNEADPVTLPGKPETSPAGTQVFLLDRSDQDRFREVARVGLQVALALEFAHQRGILHRDIKPSNILIDRDTVTWVADFGLAKGLEGDEAEGLTRTGDVVGTLRYMAPERFDGICDVRSDLYSLGATLYEMLTLQPIFRDSNRVELMGRIIREDPVRPRLVDRRVPLDLETIVLKALSREPALRYPVPAEMAADLQLYLMGEPIRSRRVGLIERAGRWARRNQLVAIFALAFFIAVAVGFGLTFWKWREATHQAEQANLARRDARRTTADLILDRGLGFLGRGETTVGRLWLARGLEIDEIEPAARRMARLNLAIWDQRSPRLTRIIAGPEPIERFAFSSNPGQVDVRDAARNRSTYDMATGARLAAIPPLVRSRSTLAGVDDSVSIDFVGDRMVVAADPKTGQPLGPPFQVANHSQRSLALLPGGKQLLDVADQGRIRDLATGAKLDQLPWIPWGTYTAVVDLQGCLITFGPGTAEPNNQLTGWVLRFWTRDGSLRASIPDLPGLGEQNSLLRLSPDGETLVISHRFGQIGFYDVRRGVMRAPLTSRGGPNLTLDFSPDGMTLATGATDGSVRFWDPATARSRGSFPTQPASVYALEYSADGRRLGLLVEGAVRIWDLIEPFPQDEALSQVDASQTSPYGTVLFAPSFEQVLTAARGQNHVRLLDRSGNDSGTAIRRHWLNSEVMAVSPSGHRWALATRDKQTTGSELFLADAHGRVLNDPLPINNWIVSMEFAPDGRTLAVTGFDGGVWLIDAETGRQRGTVTLLYGRGMALRYSRDGKTLAVSVLHDEDAKNVTSEIRLYDPATMNPIGEIACAKQTWSTFFSFGPDDRSLIIWLVNGVGGARHSYYQVWDRVTLRPRGLTLRASLYLPEAIVFLPGNRMISKGPGGLWEWDLSTGQPIHLVIAESRELTRLVLNPPGTQIIALFKDGRGQLYDAATYRPLGPPLVAAQPLAGLAFVDEGRTIIGVSPGSGGDPAIYSWNLPDPNAQSAGFDQVAGLAITTGATLDPSSNSIVPLDTTDWLSRQQSVAWSQRDAPSATAQMHQHAADLARAEALPIAEAWHLDRLVTLRPDDWQIRARRLLLAGQNGSASARIASLDQALAVVPGARVRIWSLARVTSLLDTHHAAEALPLLDRLVASYPSDRDILIERAETLHELGRPADRDADWNRAIALGPNFHRLSLYVGRLVGEGRWKQAAATLCRAVTSGSNATVKQYYHRAVATNFVGDEGGYRESCQLLIDHAGDGKDFNVDLLVASACTLSPNATTNFTVPLDLVRRTLGHAVQPRDVHIALNNQGGLQYRAGDPRAAIASIEAALNAEPGRPFPEDYIFLAMAHWSLGQHDLARQHLRRLEAIPLPVEPWALAEQNPLRREAAALVRPVPLELPVDVFAHPN